MKARASGLTLAELVIAMSITVLVGLAVASVSAALSNAYSSTEGFYQSLQTGRTTMLRVVDMVNRAKLVTAVSDGTMVLWARDANSDKKINLDEIVLLTCDEPAGEIHRLQVVFPDSMDPAAKALLNEEKTLSSIMSISGVTDMLTSSNYSSQVVLAADVRDFQVRSYPDPPYGVMVTVQMTVGQQPRSVTLRSAANLRVDMTSYVGVVGDEYVLTTSGV